MILGGDIDDDILAQPDTLGCVNHDFIANVIG